MDKQLCITESSSCTPETKTSEINYIPTKNYKEITELKKKKRKKKRGKIVAWRSAVTLRSFSVTTPCRAVRLGI